MLQYARFRLPKVATLLVLGSMILFAGASEAQMCCFAIGGQQFCANIGGPPPPPPPPPAHVWQSLPGFAWDGSIGTFSDWGGTPDHHDGLPGEHAVDIGAGQCTDSTCPSVSYFDQLHSTTAKVVQVFDATCASVPHIPDGVVVILELRSLDPQGVLQAQAVYRHLRSVSVTVGQSVDPGATLAQVDPDIQTSQCWDGAHLHQGVIAGDNSVLSELTGQGKNCPSSGHSSSTVPCYEISW